MTAATTALTPRMTPRWTTHLQRLLLLPLAVLPFVAGGLLGELQATYLIQALIMIVAVSGLHVLVHWGGQISLAQVTLMGLGAFVTTQANATLHWGLPVSIIAGVAGAVLASLAIGLPALRIKGFALAVVTLACSYGASRWLFLQTWLVPYQSGAPIRATHFVGLDVTKSRQLVIPFGLMCIGVVALTTWLGRAAAGRRLRLVAHDEEVAASYGINVASYKLGAFLYSGACAGLAGSMMVISIGRLGPPAFPVSRSIILLAAVLMGGAGSLAGSVQAAAGLALLPSLVRAVGDWVDLVAPVAILIVVIASPAGLNGVAESVVHQSLRLGRHVWPRRRSPHLNTGKEPAL